MSLFLNHLSQEVAFVALGSHPSGVHHASQELMLDVSFDLLEVSPRLLRVLH
jgi:hypothetical protein